MREVPSPRASASLSMRLAMSVLISLMLNFGASAWTTEGVICMLEVG